MTEAIGFRGASVLVAILAAVLAQAVATTPASARVGIDPCVRKTLIDTSFGQGYHPGGLACGYRELIPASKTTSIPQSDPVLCKSGTKMSQTPIQPHGLAFNQYTARWDFHSELGSWVTWGGAGEFREEDIGNGNKVAVAYHPQVHNWWEGQWRVRVFQYCDSTTDRAGEPDPGEENSAPGDQPDLGPVGDFEMEGPGADEEGGGSGVDLIRGGGGGDELRGGPGGDQLLGGDGDDVTHGGAGSDELFDNHGIDSLDGGPGNDRFAAMDGDADEIVCGGGKDVVLADPTDSTYGCEHVFTSAADAPAKPPRN